MTTPIDWGAEPEMFGPRHEARERDLLSATGRWLPESGPVLDAAAGTGTFSRRLSARGFAAVALDRSWASLLHHRAECRRRGLRPLPVLGDALALPFREAAFAAAVTAETIEHLDDDAGFARELGRVVRPGGGLAVSTPADPSQWSDWDVWAEHRRRYTRRALVGVLEAAGFRVESCRAFGFPVVRIYDAIFLRRMIRARARADRGSGSRLVALARSAGRSRFAVGLVTALFSVDRLFGATPLGVGWTLRGVKRLS